MTRLTRVMILAVGLIGSCGADSEAPDPVRKPTAEERPPQRVKRMAIPSSRAQFVAVRRLPSGELHTQCIQGEAAARRTVAGRAAGALGSSSK